MNQKTYSLWYRMAGEKLIDAIEGRCENVNECLDDAVLYAKAMQDNSTNALGKALADRLIGSIEAMRKAHHEALH